MAYSQLPTVSPLDSISSSLWGNVVKANQDFFFDALPNSAAFMADEMHQDAGSGGIEVVFDGSMLYNYYMRGFVSADADIYAQSVVLAPETYTMYILGQTRALNAKIDWYIGGSLVISGQDWYSLSPADNVVKSATVTIANGGLFKVEAKVNGRNAAATDYRIALTKVWFIPLAGF